MGFTVKCRIGDEVGVVRIFHSAQFPCPYGDLRRHWAHYNVTINVDLSMMTSSNGNIFRVAGPSSGEFTGHRCIPRTKASDAELWWVFFNCPWKRLSKEWWGWRHCNAQKVAAVDPPPPPPYIDVPLNQSFSKCQITDSSRKSKTNQLVPFFILW